MNLVAFLLAALGYFVAHRRNLQKGQLLLEETLAFLRRSKPLDRKTEAFTLLWLGWAQYFRGQLSAGAKTVQESFGSFKDMADQWAQGWGSHIMGQLCQRRISGQGTADLPPRSP